MHKLYLDLLFKALVLSTFKQFKQLFSIRKKETHSSIWKVA